MWQESQTLEFKSSFGEWKEIVETLCGFANAQGGKVVVGMGDNGQPTGTIEDFLNKVKVNKIRSRPRNRILAKVFNKLGVIEAFGTGFLRMESDCLQAGVPKPTYTEVHDAFVVTFTFATPQNTPQNEGRREQLVALIRDNPDITQSQMASALGIRRDTVKEHIERLKAEGILSRVGSDRKGKWIIQ